MFKATVNIILALIFVSISGSHGSEDNVLENCIQNSGNLNYKYHLFAKHFEIRQCLKKSGYDDDSNFIEELTGASRFYSREQLQSFIATNCPKLTNSVSCFEDLQYFNVCFEGDEAQLALIKSLPSKISSLINFMCENDGENYLNFMQNNGSAFLMNSNKIFMRCLPADYSPEDQSSKYIYPMFKASEKTVSEVKMIKDCILNGADTYHYSKAFFEKLFIIFDADFYIGINTLAYEPALLIHESANLERAVRINNFKNLIEFYKNDNSKSEMIQYLTDLVDLMTNLLEEDERYKKEFELQKNSLK